jgi:hypothetical protein
LGTGTADHDGWLYFIGVLEGRGTAPTAPAHSPASLVERTGTCSIGDPTTPEVGVTHLRAPQRSWCE